MQTNGFVLIFPLGSIEINTSAALINTEQIDGLAKDRIITQGYTIPI